VEINAIILLPQGQCQLIKKIHLYGADQVSQSNYADIFADYTGKCLANEGINKASRALQNWYIEQGFITTRITIKRQQNSLDKGNLEIWVVEGKIGIIKFNNSDFETSRIRTAFPARSGDLLNIHDLDQGLEQLNRLFSQQFRMQIKPAAKPGFSDVILIEISPTSSTGKPEPHDGRQRLSYSINNGGVKDTGEYLNSLNLTRENLAGINDVMNLTWQRGTPYKSGEKENEYLRFSSEMPWGYWFYKFSYNDSSTVRQVVGNNASFISKSKNKATSLSVNRVMTRSQTSKTELYGNLEFSDRKNFINNTQVLTSSRQTTALNLGYIFTKYLSGATLILTPSISQGTDWFGGSEDAPDIQDNQPHAQFTLLKFYSYYQHQLNTNSTFSFSFQNTFNIQYTNNALYGEKQFVLGGEYSIRGYKENILSTDNGWTLRNDFIIPIGTWSKDWHKKTWLMPLNFKVFYDIGEGYSVANGDRVSLSGWGIGLTYRYNIFSMSVTLADSLQQSDQFISDEGLVNYVNASINYIF